MQKSLESSESRRIFASSKTTSTNTNKIYSIMNTATATLPDDMLKTVIDRANEMLKDESVNKIYQSFKTKDEALGWITKAAIATLFGIPTN